MVVVVIQGHAKGLDQKIVELKSASLGNSWWQSAYIYLNHLSNYFFDVFVVYVFGLCASVRIISWFLILFSGKTKNELLYHNFQSPFLSPNYLDGH